VVGKRSPNFHFHLVLKPSWLARKEIP
jgi:hypothetical protein